MFEKWKRYTSAITGKQTWPERTMLVFVIVGFVGSCVVLGAASAALEISHREFMALFTGFVIGAGFMFWWQTR
jgi:putative flippase GtrA